MAIISPSLEFEIGDNEAIALDRLAGWALTSTNTQVWITEQNDRRDYWLKPGERHIIRGAGRVVVLSCPTSAERSARPATIRLSPPAQSVRQEGFLPKFLACRRALSGA